MNLDAYFQREGAESMTDFAQKLGHKSPDQVRAWRYGPIREGYGDRRPSLEACAAIEAATQGLVTCEELRDDVTWTRVRDKSWKWHPEGRPAVDVAKAVA